MYYLGNVRREKKPLWRWIGEAALIFLSILGAFYVDGYREHKNKESTYLKHLTDFKYDLEKTAGSMRFELSVKNDANQQSGYLPKLVKLADSLEVMVNSRNPENMERILSIVAKLDDRLSKWIFSSPHFDRITLDYYYFIKNSDLKAAIATHKRDHLHRQQSKDAVNDLLDKLVDLLIDVNFEKPDIRTNRELIFNNRIINIVSRLRLSYRILLQTTEVILERDLKILAEVDKEIDTW